jgi:hypothetical protein
LIKKMIQGPWEDDFIVKQPGEVIEFLDFKWSEDQFSPHTGPLKGHPFR